jgi:AbrB family looped-hinge helix DNA binding protein
MHNIYKVSVSNDGRILIPSAIRKVIGIKPGDQLILHIDSHKDIQISHINNELAIIQKFVKKSNPDNVSLVESLKISRDADE